MTTDYSSKENNYYTDIEIADLLGISLGRLRNKLSAGHALPPRIQPPGCRNRLWSREAVHQWLDQFTIMPADTRQGQRIIRRGRPTKQEARAERV